MTATDRRDRGRPPPHHSDLLRQSFRRAERRGFLLSLRMRLVALGVLSVAFALMQPGPVALANIAILSAFAVLGWLPYRSISRWPTARWVPFVCVVLDMLLLSWVLLGYNPAVDPHNYPQLMFRFSNFVFFFLFIGLTALTLSPGLVVTSGVAGAAAWIGGFVAVAVGDGVDVVFVPVPPPDVEPAEIAYWIDRMMAPEALVVNPLITEVIGIGLTAAILAAAATRARRLVVEQAVVARQRANLARHFAPGLVTELQDSDQPFAAPREQTVAVLFADIVGFTALSERLGPVATIDLLRAVDARLEATVFAHGGTLEKYLGDGIMATFGTPRPGARDAADAIGCGVSLLAAVDAFNADRRSQDLPTIALSVGIHYGPVVLGDVGSDRHVEFAVLGDVVNVASRLEAMTRAVKCRMLISADTVAAARDQDPGLAALQNLPPAQMLALPGRIDRIAAVAWS